MRITAIKAQIKNPDRVSVYVDGAYSFSLTQDQLLELKVRGGQELDEAQLAVLKQASDFGKAYARILNYIAIRPRSTKEIQDYCWRKKIDAEDCRAIIQKLTARGYVDDAAFARAWVESRRLTKHASRRRLWQELKQKGIDEAVITEVLDGEGHDEQAALAGIIIKKRRQSRYQDPQKLTQYLVRQGFSYGDIQEALRQEDSAA